ncbi:MAG: hypothetical protein PVI60_06615 [Desulfobacteraceae bacterium]|jgi:hypothetical protein
MGDKKDKRNIDLEWDSRVLCSDESCIGTIGADGCCRECGKPYEGELPKGFDVPEGDGTASGAGPKEDDTHNAIDENNGVEDDADEEAVSDDEWMRRILCSDESCIGVVDEETGCCKECGKPYREA